MTKKSWREVIPPHPAADLFPMMTRDELVALGEDIRKNGLGLPPILWEAKKGSPQQLLDGRNRLDAMEAVGLPVLDTGGRWLAGDLSWRCRTIRGDDPYAIALSMNIRRRHLTADQKRDLIAKLLKATPEKSNRRIAEQVKADDKTVGKVRRELEATAEIPQLETTTGRDGKARKQPAKRAVQPKQPPLPPDDDDQTIWRRGLMHRAKTAIGGAEFEDWSQFKTDRELIQTVRQAAGAWEKLALYLETAP
jgi:hypothetical protein